MSSRPQQYCGAHGGKLGTRLAHFGVTQVLEPIALAATQRAIQGIQKKRGGGISPEVREAAEHRLALAITGTIPKKRRGGKLGENLGKFVVGEVVEPIAVAGTERAVQAIQGSGGRRRGGKIGENLGKFTVHEVVEPIAVAGTERAVLAIQGSGGRRRGGKIGENLGKFTVHEVVEPIAVAGTERAVQAIQGSGVHSAVCAHCGHGALRHPIKTIEHHYAPMVGGYVANGDYVPPPKSRREQRDDATFEKSRQGMYGGWKPATPEEQDEDAARADAHGWGIPGTIADTFTSSSAERKAGRHERKYGYGVVGSAQTTEERNQQSADYRASTLAYEERRRQENAKDERMRAKQKKEDIRLRDAGPFAIFMGDGFPKGSDEAHAAMKSARAKQPRQGRFVKGSVEAKEAMAALRARRKTA